jgi:hypothetical protein
MPRLDTRPFLLWSEGRCPVGKIVLEESDCTIVKWKDVIDLAPSGVWTDRHEELARRYKVNSVGLDNQAFGRRQTAGFLLNLPPLRRVSISLGSPKDLSALGGLAELRWLRIDITLWRISDRFPPVDFSPLRKLRFADVMMCGAFESLLRCSSIQQLTVHNECDGRLRVLDLTHLPMLRELKLDHCPKLRSVMLHPRAGVHGLGLVYCGSYKIDWHRIGPKLRFLSLGGRLPFPLADILKAPKLEELYLLGIRKLPALGFLRKLSKLRKVFLFTPPPGPKLSAKDEALIREINGRAQNSDFRTG